jgi:intracellular sulfur oxidation DsrE/DsrF family protein
MTESPEPGEKPVRRKLLAIITVLIAGMAAAWLAASLQPRAPATPPPPSPAAGLTTEDGRYLFSVTLHTPEEIAGMLARAAQLAHTARADSRGTGIALVLHGPEIEIFTRKNYARFRETVDQAERLDREGIVEVKMCRTEMKHLGIREEDVPGFIELVPYGPDEETRLWREGYVYF